MKKNENFNKVREMFLRLKNQWNEEPKAVPQVIYRKGKLLGFNLLDTAVSAYAGQAAFMMILSFFPFTMFMLVLLQRLPLSPASHHCCGCISSRVIPGIYGKDH